VETTFDLSAFVEDAASASGPIVETDSPRIFAFDALCGPPADADESAFADEGESALTDESSADAVDVDVVVGAVFAAAVLRLGALGLLSDDDEDDEEDDDDDDAEEESSDFGMLAPLSPLYSDQS
jgi:hypothetical protein